MTFDDSNRPSNGHALGRDCTVLLFLRLAAVSAVHDGGLTSGSVASAELLGGVVSSTSTSGFINHMLLDIHAVRATR